MNTYRYAILPLFAPGLAFISPVLAGERDSPSVPNDEMNSTSSSEAPKLPFEKDPDGNGSERDDSTAGTATADDGSESAPPNPVAGAPAAGPGIVHSPVRVRDPSR